MRLHYNILWCEDNAEWLEEAEDQLKTHLKDLGFVAQIEYVRTENLEELETKLNLSWTYDLVLVDFKFNDQPVGGDFIERIRAHEIYAEVVFYSASPSNELHDQITRHQLEGVYIARRDSFFDKVKKVILTTIRKVLDVNAMRGIVLAATAELDKKLFDIIKVYHDRHLTNDQEKASLTDGIMHRIAAKLDERVEKHKTIATENCWQYLSSTINFWSDLRRVTLLKDILKERLQADQKASPYHSFYKDIENYAETSRQRNLLAHEQETITINNEGNTVITVGVFSFNEETAAVLRKKLVDQESAIDKLWEMLSQQQ